MDIKTIIQITNAKSAMEYEKYSQGLIQETERKYAQ